MDLNDLRKGLASFSVKVNKKLDDISKKVDKIKTSNLIVEKKTDNKSEEDIKKSLRSIDDRLRRIENKINRIDKKVK